jgi:hypothetical protein
MLALPGPPLAADELSGRRHRVEGIGGDELAVQVDLAEHPGGHRHGLLLIASMASRSSSGSGSAAVMTWSPACIWIVR